MHGQHLLSAPQAQRSPVSPPVSPPSLVDHDEMSVSDDEYEPDSDDEVWIGKHAVVHNDVDLLCLRLFSNMVDNNDTHTSVTANLQTWLASMQKYLPQEIADGIPHTSKELVARFSKQYIDLLSIPVCPGECALLDGVTPSLAYECKCNGRRNKPWRYTYVLEVYICIYVYIIILLLLLSWFYLQLPPHLPLQGRPAWSPVPPLSCRLL